MAESFDRGFEEQRQFQAPERSSEQGGQELSAPERVASSVGNQAFGTLARQGAGILPDGRAHPDVEQTIARTRGSGGSLDGNVASSLGPKMGDNFSDVRVHTDDTAHNLANSVSARAFTTGSDIYFGKGEYNPGSSDGQKLLAHELTHVVQQRGAPTSGPLTVSQPGDALENEAENTTNELGH
jgi:hypothetical protein